MRSLFSLPLIAIVVAASPAFAQEITLKQQWQVGKRYLQTMKMDQTSKIAMAGMQMDQKVKMNSEISLTVTKHEDGKRKRITVKYERMAMDTEMGPQKMSIDSANPSSASGPMGNPFAGIAGKEIRILVDENDQVTEFENLDELMKGAGGPNPFSAGFLSKDSLGQMIRQGALQALPGKPVKPGDSWPFSVDMPLPQLGKVAVNGTYTFVRMSERGGAQCAEITTEGKLTMDLSGLGASASGGNNPLSQLGMKIEGGTMSGTIWFDNTLGMAREMTMTQQMTMSMKNPANPSESMQIPMTQTITTTLTKVEDL